MKFRKIAVLAITACLVFTACGKGGEEATAVTNGAASTQTAPDTEPTEPQQEPDAPAASAELTSGTVGAYTYEVEHNFAEGKKYYDLTLRGWFCDSLDEPNAPIWLVITAGEKPTGGYEIRIVDIRDEGEGTVRVTVEESAPESGSTVTEALTYPNTTVRFDYGDEGTPRNFKVVTTGGEELQAFQ